MTNYEKAPQLIIWEVTRACDLVCFHCRANAEPERHPEELTREQGFRLLEEIASYGEPLMVFTGGDPLKRPDLFDLLAYSVKLGIRTTISPSPTPLLTPSVVKRFKEIGVDRMSISLDGPTAEIHDTFRGVRGSFQMGLRALLAARDVGLSTQVNTTVSRKNLAYLPEMAQLVRDVGADMWDVFFLVPTGRATTQDELTGEQYEQVFEFLYETSRRMPYVVKTTEAMHYRRFVALKRKQETKPEGALTGHQSMLNRMRGINSGRGLVFVSRVGDIYPSGFLPLKAGNVKQDSLTAVYRFSPLFRKLRDPKQLKGKCGRCPYNRICGGSRARAYALTGDYLAEEPKCVFQPETMNEKVPAVA